MGRSSSARLFLGVIRSLASVAEGKLLRPRLAVAASAAAVTVEDVPTADLRRGILEGEGRRGKGAVAALLIEERRRFGGIVEGDCDFI